MLQALVLLPLLASTFLPPPTPARVARAASSSGLQTSATVNGLKLSLILAKRVYPRDALIPVTVRVTNVSTSPMHIWVDPGTECGAIDEAPRVEVLDDRGQVVYPGGLPPALCHRGAMVPMSPGETFTSHPYVILRGRYLAAVVGMMGDATGVSSAVTTPKLRVRLVVEPAPRVSLRASDTNIYALIQPAAPVRGPLRYVDLALCPAVHYGPPSHPYWSKAKGRRLLSGHVPGCSPPAEWHVLAGWLDHPVVAINYRE